MAPLTEDPQARIDSLAELVGIARAIEDEAQRRYCAFSQEMARRGEAATAEAFASLAEEEGRHVEAVARWAEGLGQALPDSDAFVWRLPDELAGSWDEALASSLFTPFRAYAIAVENEQRAFAFYAYVAARAEDPQVRAEAERLGAEELRHAALLRTWRRAAWRRERAADDGPPIATSVEGPEQLAAVVGEHEEHIGLKHRALARRLQAAGDVVSAALLGPADAAPPQPSAEQGPTRVSLALLVEAQQPLERLSESLEAVLEAPPDAETQSRAQTALAEVVARIARIGRRIEALETG